MIQFVDFSLGPAVSENKCVGCGNCVERCAVEATEAISLESGVAKINRSTCYLYREIECRAICVDVCPLEAMVLQPREN